MNLDEKYKKLKDIIKNYQKAAIAFSGGVDSTFLVKVSQTILNENLLAVLVNGPFFSSNEISEARIILEDHKINHNVLKIKKNEMKKLLKNPFKRCYICKKIIFTKILKNIKKKGYQVLLDGTNKDDLKDDRPGLKALKELGVKSPLMESGLTKREIRVLSKKIGLPVWDKPAATCLATRFPFNEKITYKKLFLVEKAEDYLRKLGFKLLRVRCHENIARIEVLPEEREKLFDTILLDTISKDLKSMGFQYVTMELEGYYTGSMNLKKRNKQ